MAGTPLWPVARSIDQRRRRRANLTCSGLIRSAFVLSPILHPAMGWHARRPRGWAGVDGGRSITGRVRGNRLQFQKIFIGIRESEGHGATAFTHGMLDRDGVLSAGVDTRPERSLLRLVGKRGHRGASGECNPRWRLDCPGCAAAARVQCEPEKLATLPEAQPGPVTQPHLLVFGEPRWPGSALNATQHRSTSRWQARASLTHAMACHVRLSHHQAGGAFAAAGPQWLYCTSR